MRCLGILPCNLGENKILRCSMLNETANVFLEISFFVFIIRYVSLVLFRRATVEEIISRINVSSSKICKS